MNDNLNALPLGTELNHYVIEAVLGSGGFGIVYKAHHAHLDEQVVIKEFLPVELAGRHGNTVAPHGTSKQEVYSECLRRFMEEGRTLVKLRHPNVVRCRDLFTANGTAYLVMDFEDGLPLDELVRSLEAQGSRYTEQQLLHFLLPLADGLAYIHSQGVLHRDIKPANVFIRRSDGSPVIIDFGAAKQNFALASQSQAPFTEFYAPLEQIEGGGEAKPTVDIHAFGGLMYRLATGQMGPKAEARAMALVYGKPDPLQPAAVLAQGQYSQPFLTAIDQCLTFKANERPQSMQQVKQLLVQPEPRQHANADKYQSNATSSEATFSALDDLIALAGADSVITDTEMTMLLNKASSLGISKDKAQQYIVQQAVSKGWQLAVAVKQAEADKTGNKSTDTSDFSDRFADSFSDTNSKNTPPPGSKIPTDLRYHLNLSLRQVLHGDTVNFSFSLDELCEHCTDKESEVIAACSTCSGNGQVKIQMGIASVQQTCPTCNGHGKVIPEQCTRCHGKGRIEKIKTLSVRIPAGVNNGDRIRLKGQGNVARLGGVRSDLYIECTIDPDPQFGRSGQDLYVERYFKTLPAEGSGFAVKTLEKTLTVKVPAGYTAGQKIRLSGHGLPFKDKDSRGDLFLTLRTPDDNIDSNALFVCVEANCPALKDGQLLENIAIQTDAEGLTPLANADDNLSYPLTKVLSTAEDNQQTMAIKLVRWQKGISGKKKVIGYFQIDGFAVAAKGEVRIAIAVLALEDNLYLKVMDTEQKATLHWSKCDENNFDIGWLDTPLSWSMFAKLWRRRK